MAAIQIENIRGIRTENAIKCVDCMTNEDWENMTQGDVITQEDVENEEEIFFCDISGKQL